MSTPPQELDVWVLAGQSNMQGSAPLLGALGSQDNIWSLTSAGNWEMATEPLHKLWHSYTAAHRNIMQPGGTTEQAAENARAEDANRTHGAGLGISFGVAMHKSTGRAIGLVPAAHGGTSLEQWDQTRTGEGHNSLYGAMLDRIQRAGGQLRGILWYQGESDGGEPQASTYAERFDKWVEAVRRDTGQPDLPVIVVQLGRVIRPVTEDAPPYSSPWNTVRTALATLPQRQANTGSVAAIDLELSDTIHIGTAGLIRLGKRMAHAAQALAAGQPTSAQLRKLTYIPTKNGQHTVRLEFEGVTGGWWPRESIRGFTTHRSDGSLHDVQICNVGTSADDPTSLRVLLSGPLDADFYLAYGMGLNPPCNAVDQGDMGLETFEPRHVELPA